MCSQLSRFFVKINQRIIIIIIIIINIGETALFQP
jgi:hypothetical protein